MECLLTVLKHIDYVVILERLHFSVVLEGRNIGHSVICEIDKMIDDSYLMVWCENGIDAKPYRRVLGPLLDHGCFVHP